MLCWNLGQYLDIFLVIVLIYDVFVQLLNFIISLSNHCQGFSCSSVDKESACNAGYPGLIPGSQKSPGERIGYLFQYSWASLVAQLVKNLPAMQETCVQSLGWEDPLEKEGLPTPVFWPGEFHGLIVHVFLDCRHCPNFCKLHSISLGLFTLTLQSKIFVCL